MALGLALGFALRLSLFALGFALRLALCFALRIARGGVARCGRFARSRRMCTGWRTGQGARLRRRGGAQGGDRVRQQRIDIEARFVGACAGRHPGNPVGTAGQAEALGELAGCMHADGRYMLAVLANRTAALSGHQQLAVLERDPDLLLVGVRCRSVDLGVDGRMAIVALGDRVRWYPWPRCQSRSRKFARNSLSTNAMQLIRSFRGRLGTVVRCLPGKAGRVAKDCVGGFDAPSSWVRSGGIAGRVSAYRVYGV